MNNSINYKVVVYTSNFNNYESVKEPMFIDHCVQYILYTDNPNIESTFWDVRLIDDNIQNPRRKSRLPKILPHKYLPAHDISIYFDSSLEIVENNITRMINECLEDHEIALYRHYKRYCIYDEIDFCKNDGKEIPEVCNKIRLKYQTEGFPRNYGLFENAIIFRKNTQQIRALNELWWQEYMKGSQRDQFSFIYCCWKLGIKPNPIKIGKQFRINPYVNWTKHKFNSYFEIDRQPDNIPNTAVDDIINAANYAMNIKAWDRAIPLWQKLFATHKDQAPPEAYVLYSMANRFQGKHTQAEAVITQGVKKFPEDIKIHSEFAQVAKSRGNSKQAEKHLKISEMLSSVQTKDDSPIEIIDTDKIDSFRYSDPDGVAVIMPCIDTKRGLKTADILQRRAGMPCKIIVANDTLRQGFIKTANETFKRLDVKYVVYLAQDAFPGREWLFLAYQTLEKTEKCLLAFNDGKWHGKTASFGLVRTDWVKNLYKINLFYYKYISTGADAELSSIAISQNVYIYNPNCLLIEIDYLKDLKGHGNKTDRELFKKRLATGFDNKANIKNIQTIANEYAVSCLKK